MSLDTSDNPIKAEKRKKLHALREKGINPFPYSFDVTAKTADLVKDFSSLNAGDKKTETNFRIAGRLMT